MLYFFYCLAERTCVRRVDLLSLIFYLLLLYSNYLLPLCGPCTKSDNMETVENVGDLNEFELSELQSLSKDDLIKRIITLNRDKKELMVKLGAYAVSKMEEDLTLNSSECHSPSCEGLDTNPKMKKAARGVSSGQKPFDFSRYHKRHVALKMAYLGWDYHGFASQESTENTIESHFFAALSKACLIESRDDCNYSRCGRTDKGVSAFAQVVSLDVRSNLMEGLGVIMSGNQEKVQQRTEKSKVTEEIPYPHVLNKLLPPEIRIIAWTPVSQDFDARFSCLQRTYKYYFPAANVDISVMNQAAQKFVGEHDFRNFCKMDVASGVVTFRRNLLSFTVYRSNSESQSCSGYDMCEMIICGSAFLWHQVRCVVAVLLMIGQKLENPEVIDWMLDIEQCPQRPQYNMASEIPLVLYDCAFEGLSWKHEPGVLNALLKDFQAQWSAHAIKAAVLTNLIDKLEEAPILAEISGEDSAQLNGSDENDKHLVKWCDIKPPHYYQLIPLVPLQVAVKTHRPLMKRALHDSFESKLEAVNAKRRKAGKKELSEKCSGAEIKE